MDEHTYMDRPLWNIGIVLCLRVWLWLRDIYLFIMYKTTTANAWYDSTIIYASKPKYK